MKKASRILALSLALPFVLIACRTPEERVRDEKKQGAKEVSSAAEKVRETEAKAAKDIAGATSPSDLANKKIDATKDLANANEKLRDEKAEATKEVAEAEIDAGKGGTFQKQ